MKPSITEIKLEDKIASIIMSLVEIAHYEDLDIEDMWDIAEAKAKDIINLVNNK